MGQIRVFCEVIIRRLAVQGGDLDGAMVSSKLCRLLETLSTRPRGLAAQAYVIRQCETKRCLMALMQTRVHAAIQLMELS